MSAASHAGKLRRLRKVFCFGRGRVDPWILSLDVGTSSVRALGYDITGKPLPRLAYSIGHAPLTTVDGGSEFEAAQLLGRCVAVLRSALDRRPDMPPPVAVATTTFWHSLVGLDANGKAISPVYLWSDTRSAAYTEALRQRLDETAAHARTGCLFHTSYLPARLLWLQQEHPDLVAEVRYWVSFADYAYHSLFGTLATSFSMASGSGLFNQNQLDWDDEVCRAIGVRHGALPQLVDTTHHFAGLRGPYLRRLPELASIPWLPATGDGACSNVGSGCTRPNRLALMVGTSGAMRCVIERPHLLPPPGLWCYRLDSRRFVFGGALSNGGNLFAWLGNSLRLPAPGRIEAELAAMEPDSHGLTILPFLAGERSPGWSSHATGAFLGLRQHTTPLQIVRAALEAVALRFACIYERLREAAPAATLIVATGGALLRSPAWMQIMADALGSPVQASLEAEASSRGAALLGLESLRVITDLTAVPAGLGEIYEPRPSFTERYLAARHRQEQAYRQIVARGPQGLPQR